MFKLRGFIAALCLAVVWSSSAIAGSLTSSVGPVANQNNRWRSNTIRVSVSQSLTRFTPNIKSDSDIDGAIQRSFAAWRDVTDIEFVIDTSERQSVSPVGTTGDGVSLITVAPSSDNVLLFEKGEDIAAAKTRVFINRRGFITEADIVLNPFQQFSTDGTFGTFDLESTLKHEIGHLLGLRHSSVVGSIMYDVSARNGVFGDTGQISRNISDDDMAAVRDLYGFKGTPDCCGVVSGRLIASGRITKAVDVWLQDSETGSVVGHTVSTRDGSFRVGGLQAGTYMLLGRESGSGESSLVTLGRVTVTNGQIVTVSRKFVLRPRDFSLRFLGRNGILSDSPVTFERGNSTVLFVGGEGLGSGRIRFETGSPFATIENGSVSPQEFDAGVSGMRLTVRVAPDAPKGNYNICAVSESGVSDCIVGGLSVGE